MGTKTRLAAAVVLVPLLSAASFADACTRAVYLGPGGNVITARSMDWKSDVGTNLWIFPRGMARTGEAGPNSIVSVPYGLKTPEAPNISSTRWRTVVDHKRKLYFFESALTPNTFWVDLSSVDFSPETGTVRMLDLGPNQDHTYSGDATKQFKNARAFEFLRVR
jgi:penicillin V acylase-like amidase (Ntn superfamily)